MEYNDVIAFSPALYFNQFLDDDEPKQREEGLMAGLRILKHCDEVWVYGGMGNESDGMSREIAFARLIEKRVNYRE